MKCKTFRLVLYLGEVRLGWFSLLRWLGRSRWLNSENSLRGGPTGLLTASGRRTRKHHLHHVMPISSVKMGHVRRGVWCRWRRGCDWRVWQPSTVNWRRLRKIGRVRVHRHGRAGDGPRRSGSARSQQGTLTGSGIRWGRGGGAGAGDMGQGMRGKGTIAWRLTPGGLVEEAALDAGRFGEANCRQGSGIPIGAALGSGWLSRKFLWNKIRAVNMALVN